MSELSQIDRLKEAGADEIKLNLETFDPEIFKKVCGELDLDWIMEALEHAVEVFGRGKVTSNIIIGMGESDRIHIGRGGNAWRAWASWPP